MAKNEVKFAVGTDATMDALRAIEFERGYICAVTNLVTLHDQPTMALDLLRQLGKINWDHIAEYDRRILKPLLGDEK